MALAFMCCCAPDAAGHEETTQSVDAVREVTGDPTLPAAGPLGKTATPNFPAPARTPRKDGPAPAKPGDKKGAMSPREKEQEKARLQEVVKEFSRRAIGGIPVQMIDSETKNVTDHEFIMDKYLYTLSLKMGAAEDVPQRNFNIKDMSAIYKGPDVAAKVANLAAESSGIVGVDFNGASEARIFFHFKDSGERDKFYTCLKILRMSVDINTNDNGNK